MEVTIRNRGGESTLTIKGDFYQILDEYFTEICGAITNKVKILKELKALFDTDDQVFDTIVQIIMKSIGPDAAALKLQDELNLSKMATFYLLSRSLSSLVSLNAEGIEQELTEYKEQLQAICTFCQPEIEFIECEGIKETQTICKK